MPGVIKRYVTGQELQEKGIEFSLERSLTAFRSNTGRHQPLPVYWASLSASVSFFFTSHATPLYLGDITPWHWRSVKHNKDEYRPQCQDAYFWTNTSGQKRHASSGSVKFTVLTGIYQKPLQNKSGNPQRGLFLKLLTVIYTTQIIVLEIRNLVRGIVFGVNKSDLCHSVLMLRFFFYTYITELG